MKLVTDMMGDRQIKVTVKQSVKGAMVVGACSFLGGLVAGPVGLAVGGASGGVAAAFMTSGTFKSVTQVLNELPYERKRQIAIEIQSIMERLEINDLAHLTQLALLCASVTQPIGPQNVLVQKFISESITVIQRQMLVENNQSALN